MGNKFKAKPGTTPDLPAGQRPVDPELDAKLKEDIPIEDEFDGGAGGGDYDDVAGGLFDDDEPNEIVESLGFDLHDGRTVVMRAPTTFEGFRVDSMLVDKPFATMSRQYAMALMHIVSIDGKPFNKPTTKGELHSKANFIGSKGMEEVLLAYVQHFSAGPNLRNVKKNLR